MRLRPYQERAVAAAREAFRAGARGVVLTLPTGAGKTVIAAHVARSHGRSPLVLCHRTELIDQTRAKLAAVGASAEVASIQTLVRRLDRLPPATLLIVDECHHMGADLWAELPRAYGSIPRLGLTATPQRGDGRGLVGFDALVAPVSARELTELGHLVPCSVWAPPEAQQPMADPVAALRELAPDGRAVVFAATVAHAEELARELGGLCVDGELHEDERRRRLAAFASGAVRVLTNVYVLTEGWDCPAADVCVVARGCGSAGTWLQMVGRVLRPSPGKARALVIDCKGSVYQHGLPADDRTWHLDGESHRLPPRLDPLRQCPQCGGVARSTATCPACGYAFPPPPPPQARRMALEVVDHVTPQQEKRAFYVAMLRRCAARGHKPGAAAHLFRARFGHWPDRAWTVGAAWHPGTPSPTSSRGSGAR